MGTYEKIELELNLPFKLIDIYLENQNAQIEIHYHRSIEILIPILGDVHLWVLNQEIKVKAGDLYIINSKEPHFLSGFENSDIYKGFCLQISYDYIKNYCHDIDHYYFTQIKDEQTKQQVLKIIYSIISTYQQNNEYSHLKITSDLLMLIYIFIIKLKTERKNFSNLKKTHNQRIVEITQYIDLNYQDDLTINKIAHHFNISSGHLTKLFKMHMHITPKEYITKIRLQNAHGDVILSDETIMEIALKNGFPNVKAFNHEFKKVYEITPLHYRQKMRILP